MGGRMKISEIFRFRFLFNIDPSGIEVDEGIFNKYMAHFPHARRKSFGNANVYYHMWLGKEKVISMYHLETGKYYIEEEDEKDC